MVILISFPSIRRKVVIIMSTYEEFMVILTIGLLIIVILILKSKKKPSCQIVRMYERAQDETVLYLLFSKRNFCGTIKSENIFRQSGTVSIPLYEGVKGASTCPG